MSPSIPREPLWHITQFHFVDTIGMDTITQFESAFSHAPCAPKTRRETIYLPNDAADRLFLVKYGRVVLGQVGRDGKEVLFDVVQSGEIFGEMAVLGEERRATFSRALERSMVCSIRSEDFRRMIGDRPYLLSALTEVIGTRERRIEARLADMVFKDAAGRLATQLVRLGQESGTRAARGIRLELCVSQEELGSLIGTTRETVSQLLGRFTDVGLIARDGRTIWLTDTAGLVALAGLGAER